MSERGPASDRERDLKQRFQAMRAEDGRRAPDFAGIWREARRLSAERGGARNIRAFPRPILLPAWGALGAAALAIVALLALVPRIGGDRERTLPDEEAIAAGRALSSWEAPSDSLLVSATVGAFFALDGDLDATCLPLPESPDAEADPDRHGW